MNADVKARTVKQLAEKWQIPTSQTVAMGDGANDLVMMAESALGVACHGKPLVNEKPMSQFVLAVCTACFIFLINRKAGGCASRF